MASVNPSTGTLLREPPDVARRAQGLSLRNFLASLVTSASISFVEVFLFVLLNNYLGQV